MYKVGQDNRMHKCLTTSKAQIVLKELHEGVVGRHFALDITIKKILDVGYWWPTSFMIFTKVVTSIRKLED
jgi:hypothetical protein